MATVEEFNHLLNWKLKAGSHPFPGPDGGTCINEAALIAAGFKYQPIRYETEMPECFSRSICCLAMELNDQASDEDRQRLLALVARPAGAGTAGGGRRRSGAGARRQRGRPAAAPAVRDPPGLRRHGGGRTAAGRLHPASHKRLCQAAL